MRTLFLNGMKSKQQLWLRVLWIGLLTVLSVGLLATFDVFPGWAFSDVRLFVAVVIASVVSALLVCWVLQRRLQNTVQNLKDSALW
jgi:hydrogenase-4 membrane subunit HyfE